MKPEDFALPVDEPVDIGSGATITLHVHDGEVIGCTEAHKDKDGKRCIGFVRFDGPKWGFGSENTPKWKVEQANPLTLSPSILCRTCGNHGFIRAGKWVSA